MVDQHQEQLSIQLYVDVPYTHAPQKPQFLAEELLSLELNSTLD